MILYNSLTKKKELFVPIEAKKVKMYVCGITPYDTTHLGHAFTYVSFDTLFRYLTFKGFDVSYVQNVTDIDADILKKAKEVKRDWKELGEFWTKRFLSDMQTLNILPPTHYVKATDSITTMIDIIEILLEKGFAYEGDGNVYFEIKKDKSYGKLSRLNKKQMLLISKERGNNPNDPFKKDPLDFVLWQKSGQDEPSWNSPWSKGRPASRRGSPGGRPGWHIECSAMVKEYLGDTIDIHGGGRDLIYPHHESEITQSENYTGKTPYVKYWMHTAMLMYEGEKMSKSLGNLVMVADLLKKYSANEIRFLLLSHHYKNPWEFEETQLADAQEKINIIQNALNLTANQTITKRNEFTEKFELFMDDDLNTPDALNYLVALAKEALINKSQKNKSSVKEILPTSLSVLGFSF